MSDAIAPEHQNMPESMNTDQPEFLEPSQPQLTPFQAQVAANSTQSTDDVKQKIEEMDKEAAKLRELHAKMTSEADAASEEEKRDIDSRSIYIGNVDYSATPQELQMLFSESGVVNRVTIMTNKFTQQPKGFAYLEFADEDAVNKAVATQDGVVFRDRELKVSAKRTNVPGYSSTNRGRGRGRGGLRGRGGFRGRARGRGAFRGAPRFAPY